MRKYRQSSNIIDKRKADFTEQVMNSYSVRAKKESPNPLTYKEPMEYQHDDLTDNLNFKNNITRPNNKVPGKGFVTDNLMMAKNRKLGTKPSKLKFLEPSTVGAQRSKTAKKTK
jgi:hypothetical protein